MLAGEGSYAQNREKQVMPQEELISLLKRDVREWNAWRKNNAHVRLDFRGVNLSDVDLRGVNLSGVNLNEANLIDINLSGANLSNARIYEANLSRANLSGTNLSEANLSEANLSEANLSRADLSNANLNGAVVIRTDLNESNLSGAYLNGADLRWSNLSGSYLRGVRLIEANLIEVDLSEADLSEANLDGANLSRANLSRTNLKGANLSRTLLIGTNLTHATLSGCTIYGISAWNVHLEGAIQENLIITQEHEATITIDNLKVAQFIYLMLSNQEIRDVINTLTTKSVLILGRFTPERKAILEVLQEVLRAHNYLPILFDFETPKDRNLTETVRILAHLARFIIADLTEPSSIPQELQAIIPTLAITVQPILLEEKKEYAMFHDFSRYHWVLPTYFYTDQANLITSMETHIIQSAEQKAKELELPHI
ncbi:MAG TPA: pentapeptide repeat-containing protein [Dictyobacter sp.]|nr:pentapeptide repeat-containing protein [Dictyobacter sp.]